MLSALNLYPNWRPWPYFISTILVAEPFSESPSARCTAVEKRFQNAGSRTRPISCGGCESGRVKCTCWSGEGSWTLGRRGALPILRFFGALGSKIEIPRLAGCIKECGERSIERVEKVSRSSRATSLSRGVLGEDAIVEYRQLNLSFCFDPVKEWKSQPRNE